MINKILFPITLANSLIMAWFIWGIKHDIVALHYNMHGDTDSYGSKWILLIFAVIPLVLSVIFSLYKNFTKNSPNKKDNESAENKIISIIITFFILIGWIITVVASNNPQKLDILIIHTIIGLLALLIICISTFMPQIKPNKFLGIRTSATLKDESVWYKTHKFGFYSGVIGGILTILFSIISLITNTRWLCFVGLACGVTGAIIPAIYSYIILKKQR